MSITVFISVNMMSITDINTGGKLMSIYINTSFCITDINTGGKHDVLLQI